MIDWKDQERPITLRDGSEALVVGIVDGNLVGVIFSYRASPRDFFTCVWNEDGSYRADRSTSPMDLIQAPKREEEEDEDDLGMGGRLLLGGRMT